MESVKVINKIYEHINIYRSIILYDETTFGKIRRIKKHLSKHDFSAFHLKNKVEKSDMDRHRVYIAHTDILDDLDSYCDQESITIYFCLTNQIYDRLCLSNFELKNAILFKI